MVSSEEVKCPYCDKVFYLHAMRYKLAKTITCMICNKRFNKMFAKGWKDETK